MEDGGVQGLGYVLVPGEGGCDGTAAMVHRGHGKLKGLGAPHMGLL